MILSNDAKFNKVFMIACALLLLATVGWESLTVAFKWAIRKERIEWPVGVEVDGREFFNRSFAKTFGTLDDGTPRYVLRFPEDNYDNKLRKPGQDNIPDGFIVFKQDMKETLGIGIGVDASMIAHRKSNWYMSRRYEDLAKPEKTPFRYWMMSVDYYTSSELTVPHVPDVCAVAGGAKLVGKPRLLPVPGAGLPKPWDTDTMLKALTFEKNDPASGQTRRFTQYYLFSCNGHPETDRDMVRLKLTAMTLRYVYYAKIQFNLVYDVNNPDQADKAAVEFLRNALPEILTQLPLAEDVDKLNS